MINNVQKKIGAVVTILFIGTLFLYMPGCGMAGMFFSDNTVYAQTESNVVMMDHSAHVAPATDTMCHGITKTSIQQKMVFVTLKSATLKTTSCCLQHLRSGEDTAQRFHQTEKPFTIQSGVVSYPPSMENGMIACQKPFFVIKGLSPPDTFSLIGSVVKKE